MITPDDMRTLSKKNIPVYYFWGGMSVRARRAVVFLRIEYLEELNPAKLSSVTVVRGCGISTRDELTALVSQVNELRTKQRRTSNG